MCVGDGQSRFGGRSPAAEEREEMWGKADGSCAVKKKAKK
jgi:hypothetical protein